MLFAGTNMSATIIELALVELIKQPNIIKKIQDELDDVIGQEKVVDENDITRLKYLQTTVKETFRLYPPALVLVPHEKKKACEIKGYYIFTKNHIFMYAWAIYRHPFAFENPFNFNPERFVGSAINVRGTKFQLLPFGYRQQVCLGLNYGLLMAQFELARLVHNFTWRLPRGMNP